MDRLTKKIITLLDNDYVFTAIVIIAGITLFYREIILRII